jgi:hypothetical protein
MLVRWTLLYFLTSVLLVQLPSSALAQSTDAYAIYSALITASPVVRSGPGNVPTDDQIYLIDATTITDRTGFGPPGGRSFFTAESCLNVPPLDDAGFREIVADYNLRKNTPAVLKRLFSFTKPYQLLTATESDRFLREAQEATPPVNRNPLYSKSKRVFRLGDVYFNKARTLAVVFFSVYTTAANGSGSWRAFRKAANGQWQTSMSWATCTWSSAR